MFHATLFDDSPMDQADAVMGRLVSIRIHRQESANHSHVMNMTLLSALPQVTDNALFCGQ